MLCAASLPVHIDEAPAWGGRFVRVGPTPAAYDDAERIRCAPVASAATQHLVARVLLAALRLDFVQGDAFNAPEEVAGVQVEVAPRGARVV